MRVTFGRLKELIRESQFGVLNMWADEIEDAYRDSEEARRLGSDLVPEPAVFMRRAAQEGVPDPKEYRRSTMIDMADYVEDLGVYNASGWFRWMASRCDDAPQRESIKLDQFISEQLRIMEERAHRVIQLQKSDNGYQIIDPEHGQRLADEDAVKKMGADRRNWLLFFKEHGVDTVVMKGMARGGADKELPRQAFLDKVIGPRQGKVVPVVMGKPIENPKVAHAPISGDMMKKPEKSPVPSSRPGRRV